MATRARAEAGGDVSWAMPSFSAKLGFPLPPGQPGVSAHADPLIGVGTGFVVPSEQRHVGLKRTGMYHDPTPDGTKYY